MNGGGRQHWLCNFSVLLCSITLFVISSTLKGTISQWYRQIAKLVVFVFVFFSVYFVFYGVNKTWNKKCLLSNSTAVDDGYSSFSIQRFQPCQLKKLNKGGLWRAPKAWASTYRGPGACSSAKNFQICVSKMPFPAFWDHEWTQTLHWRSRQSSALLRPKLWQAHARMPEKGKNGKQSCRKTG